MLFLKESMMKWRVRRNSRSSPIDNDDVRQSLDILDSVLAEFDDDNIDASSHVTKSNGYHQEDGFATNGVSETGISRRRNSSALQRSSGNDFRFEDMSPPAVSKQRRKFSPPPVPKRSLATRLSSKEDLFRCSLENIPDFRTFLDESSIGGIPIVASRRSHNGYHEQLTVKDNVALSANEKTAIVDNSTAIAVIPNGASTSLSNQSSARAITKSVSCSMSSNSDCDMAFLDDDVFVTDRRQKHENMDCGSNKSPSIASRRAMYEQISENSSPKHEKIKTKPSFRAASKSDSSVDAACLPVSHSPFLRRKVSSYRPKDNSVDTIVSKVKSDDNNAPVVAREAQTEISLIPGSDMKLANDGNVLKDGIENRLQPSLPVTKEEVEIAERVGQQPSVSSRRDNRISILDNKFSEVRYLIKTNKIKALDEEPPRFIPPPPPKHRPEDELIPGNENYILNSCHANKDKRPPDFASNLSDTTRKDTNINDQKTVSNGYMASAEDNESVDSGSFCGRTVPFVQNVEDIPKLLPTDLLNRPMLGLSYSMEDDLGPGAKDILTSTPKSGKIGLSTFSQSISSLGYSSGQSSLELNTSCKDQNYDKVPITSLKSQTLPTGMKLGPPFPFTPEMSAHSDEVRYSPSPDSEEAHYKLHEQEKHHRSVSAPPSKQLQHRKYMFGMSRKEKKEDKKKDKHPAAETYTVKYEPSIGNGVILQNVEPVELSQSLSSSKKVETEEKLKRKSTWKSFLQKK